jgi:HEAT repeat protein
MVPFHVNSLRQIARRSGAGILLCFFMLSFPSEALGQKDEVSPVISKLKDPDNSVRVGAAEALATIKDSRAVVPLIAALKDRDLFVRTAAAKALGKIKDSRAVVPLIAALKDPDPFVPGAAANALGEIKDPRAAEPLIAALKHPDSNVRYFAAAALGKIKDPRAAEPLIAALKDPDSDVRRGAAKALREIKGPRATEALIAALKDPVSDVPREAATALSNIKGSRAAEAQIVTPIPQVSIRKDIGFFEASDAVPNLQAFKFDEGFIVRLSYSSLEKRTISPDNNVTFSEMIPDIPIRVGDKELGILVSAYKNAQLIGPTVVGTPVNIIFTNPLNKHWYVKIGEKKCQFVGQIVVIYAAKSHSPALLCTTGSSAIVEEFLKTILSGPLPSEVTPVARLQSHEGKQLMWKDLVDQSNNEISLMSEEGKKVQVSVLKVGLHEGYLIIVLDGSAP